MERSYSTILGIWGETVYRRLSPQNRVTTTDNDCRTPQSQSHWRLFSLPNVLTINIEQQVAVGFWS
jgi:hypothetical protein